MAHSGCGQVETTEASGVETTRSAVEGPFPSTPPNTTLEQKYLPGLGYFDGTTCDSWPKDVNFKDAANTPMGVISAFLGRVAPTAPAGFLQGTKALNSRMTTMAIGGATVFGAKRELAVLYGTVSPTSTTSEKTLVAVDASSRQGFMIDDNWLCTEADLHGNPNNCKLWDVVVGQGPFVTYKALGRTTKFSARVSNTVMLVAPQVRFVPQGTSNELVTNVNLIAIGQRVYGGAPYTAGEDLSKRTTGLAALKAIPTLPTFGPALSTSQWKVALTQPRKPSLLALIADEVGGFQQVSAFAPALVESLTIGTTFTDAARIDQTTGRLTLRPEELFQPTFQLSPTGNICFGVTTNGVDYTLGACDYHLQTAAMPTVRSAGGSGTAMIISGKTPNAASVTATTGTAILPTYSTADLRTLISGWVKPKLDLVTTHWLSAVGNLIDGEPWKLDPTYQSRSLTTLTNAMATQINGKFFSTAAAYPAFTSATTSPSDAAMAANLFSRGTFVDVLYAGSEIDSLRAGSIAGSWNDSWRLMSEDTLNASQITSFDAVADFGASAAKRTRALQMFRYLTIGAPGGVQSNVLGLPYGTVAGGWYALRDQGAESLYAAQGRWANLASVVDSFQTAAGMATQISNAAQHDALVQAVNGVYSGLQGEFTSISQAATNLSSAAKLNITVQQNALNEFSSDFNTAVGLSNSLQTGLGSVLGCSPSAGNCADAVAAKLQSLQSACQNDNGLDWLDAVVSVVGVFVPPLADANTVVTAITGSDIVGNLGNLLKAASPGQPVPPPNVGTYVSALKGSDQQFATLETNLQAAAQEGQAMYNLMTQFTPCPKGGQAQTNLDSFKSTMLVQINSVQSLANMIRLLHADIDSLLGQLAYLASQGQSYDTLTDAQGQLGGALDANTAPLLQTLTTLTNGGSYSQIAAQEKAFLTNACQTALTATRTGLADLHVISQALQTSTGRTSTKPYLVVPANPAYHFANGATPVEMNKYDVTSDFVFSLWDDGAFSSRFTPAGTSATASFMSQATARFTQLMNTEVCEDGPVNPASRFLVRKVLTGQALRTLVQAGKVDFGVTLDDIVAASNANPTVKGVESLDLQNDAFDLLLGGAFVVSAGYSACNGTTVGQECCPTCRIPSSALATAGGGAVSSVYLANRGQTYMPTAPPIFVHCPAGQELVTSTALLTLPTGTSRLTTCLAPLITPRTSASMTYLPDASSPDNQVLNAHMQDTQCLVTAATLASRPLQGLPVLGTWALAKNTATAAALNQTSTAAPISPTAPAVNGVTGVEVLFLVGTEAVETGETPAYALF